MSGIKIYKPNYTMFDTTDIQIDVFSKFKEGVYTSIEDMKKISHLLFDLYHQKLDRLIKEYSGWDLLEICFSQYNSSHQIQKVTGNVGLGVENNSIIWKQAYKYLIELITKNSPELKDVDTNEEVVNEIFCLVEELFNFGNFIAELRFGKEFGQIELSHNKKFGTTFCNYTGDSELNKKIFEKFKESNDLYNIIYSEKYTRYNKELQYEYLNDIFEEILGCSFKKYLDILSTFWHKDSMDIFPKTKLGMIYIKENELVDILVSETFLTEKSIRIMLDTISLTNNNVQDRQIYNPDNQYRLYSRFLIKLNYDNENIYFRDDLMAKECWELLIGNFMAGITPPEFDDKIKKEVSKMALNYTKDFEDYISEEFKKIGYKGREWNVNKKFDPKGSLILPSDGVGEIDWIGVNPNLDKICIFEFKTNKLAAISIQQGNEIDKFTKYGEKFNKKIKRVEDNLEEIKLEFEDVFNTKIDNNEIEKNMITEFVTVYSFIEKDFKVEDFCIYLEEIKKIYIKIKFPCPNQNNN